MYGDTKTKNDRMSPKHRASGIFGKRGNKIAKVMHEYKERKLHSGSKSGPTVHSRKQAIAIGMSEQREQALKKKMK